MSSSNDYVIISGVRTPFGRFGGSLKDVNVIDLGAEVMKEAIKRAGLTPEQIDEVWWGCGDTSNTDDVFTPVVGRQSLLEAGLPPETPCCTFDKACVSGSSAILYAIRALKAGDAQIVLCGGATHFSSVPYLLRDIRFKGSKIGALKLFDPLSPLGYVRYNPVSVDSGEVAVEYGISREEQDQWALRSHQKYGEAWKAGKFKEEIKPWELKQKDGSVKLLDIDEQYRPETTLEKLAKLPTIFNNVGGITAGNAPGLNDGAVAMVVTTRKKAEELGVKPLATVVNAVTTGANPRKLPIAPAVAIKKCLSEVNMTIDDMDIVEINEAFACVPLVSAKILADMDETKYQQIKEKMNVNGSAISTGHANCASGARIVLTMIHELKRRGGGYGVMGICGGLTQGDSILIKVEA
ncbi:MAG TPA: thiolase family protein [Syntrophomonadaceae bacterium]|nr:thiolase family protein [Syntrophomonadaceae bacterium]HQE23437.1 thiolase family protein [Syntrophomonadaceae bacterium]